jgi:hypothetical protein
MRLREKQKPIEQVNNGPCVLLIEKGRAGMKPWRLEQVDPRRKCREKAQVGDQCGRG